MIQIQNMNIILYTHKEKEIVFENHSKIQLLKLLKQHPPRKGKERGRDRKL